MREVNEQSHSPQRESYFKQKKNSQQPSYLNSQLDHTTIITTSQKIEQLRLRQNEMKIKENG